MEGTAGEDLKDDDPFQVLGGAEAPQEDIV